MLTILPDLLFMRSLLVSPPLVLGRRPSQTARLTPARVLYLASFLLSEALRRFLVFFLPEPIFLQRCVFGLRRDPLLHDFFFLEDLRFFFLPPAERRLEERFLERRFLERLRLDDLRLERRRFFLPPAERRLEERFLERRFLERLRLEDLRLERLRLEDLRFRFLAPAVRRRVEVWSCM